MPLEETEADARQYDEERAEVGGFGSSAGRVQVIQQINHEGEVCNHGAHAVLVSCLADMCEDLQVNRARYMPQNPYMIATKTINAEVLVFDYSKHPSKAPSDGKLLCESSILLHTRLPAES